MSCFNPPRCSSHRGTPGAADGRPVGRFQSAPVFITPGNRRVPQGDPRREGVSIRPGVHHTGERRLVRMGRVHTCFNPPRCSSHRGTSPPWQPPWPRSVSIRPGVHHTGERGDVSDGDALLRFQSAPVFITPGNRAGEAGQAPLRGFNPPRCSSHRGTAYSPDEVPQRPVSIRPGVHHTGERGGAGGHSPCTSGFNPPRCSSHRGTLVTVASLFQPIWFQSAPVFITPGNARVGGRWVTSEEFQSAPVFITPGNGSPCSLRRSCG